MLLSAQENDIFYLSSLNLQSKIYVARAYEMCKLYDQCDSG